MVTESSVKKLRIATATLAAVALLLGSVPAAQGQDEQMTLSHARALESIAMQAYEQGGYELAIPFAKEACLIRERLQGERHPDHLKCLHALAVFYDSAGHHEEAEPILVRLRDLIKQVHGETSPEYAICLANLAANYVETGRRAESEPLILQALDILKNAQGEKHSNYLTVLTHLAALYVNTARYAEAELRLRQILELTRDQKGENLRLRITGLGDLAELYTKTARYAEVEPLIQEALEVTRNSSGEDSLEFAAVLSKLAKFYEEAGRYSEAEELFQRVLNTVKVKLGEQHPTYASILEDLANVYAHTGRYAEAESHYRQALELEKSAEGDGRLNYAHTLSGLAMLYDRAARYAEAEPLLLKAKEIYGERLGESHVNYSLILGNLAVLYQHTGRYRESEDLNRKAIKIVKDTLGEQHPDYAAVLNNLARLYDSVRRYPEAERLYSEATEIYRKALGRKHPTYAMALNNLALLYHRMGRYEEAASLYRETLEIKKETLGEKHPSYATGLNNLGALYDGMGDYKKAEPLLLQALELRRNALGDEHPDCAQTLGNLGELYEATGRPHEALSAMTRTLEIEQHNMRSVFSGSSEAAMLEYSAMVGVSLERFLSFARIEQRSHPDAVDAAFTWTLRRKGFILDTLVRFRRAQLLAHDDPSVTKRIADLRHLRENLSNLALNPPAGIDAEALRRQMDTLRYEANGIEAELNRALDDAHRQNGVELSIEAVRRRLSPDSSLIEFVRADILDFNATGESPWRPAHYFAFVLDADPQAPIRMVDLGDASRIDDAIRKLREHITATKSFLKGTTEQQFREAELDREDSYRLLGKELYDLVFAPVRKEIGKARTLYVAPDGQLTLIPFEALVANTSGSVKYLIEEYRFDYLTSGRDLLHDADRLGCGAVVFADPDYELTAEKRAAGMGGLNASTTLSSKPVAATPASGSGTGAVTPCQPQTQAGSPAYHSTLPPDLRVRGGGSKWERLESSAGEAADVRRALAGTSYGPVTVYLYQSALEETLKRMRSPRLLHLSTHGFFLPPDQSARELKDLYGVEMQRTGGGPAAVGLARLDAASGENPLLRSGFVLAGANRLGEPSPWVSRVDDGWVTAEEVATLNLTGTDLVVLPACGTGLGAVAAGEGVYGLRRALHLAGASTIISTLFDVSDKDSSELMHDFYLGLRMGRGKLTALREAQLRLIRNRRRLGGAAHPFFWAGFVLNGDAN